MTEALSLALETREGVFVKPAQFWLVWNKNGHNPRVSHAFKSKAEKEARRLARKFPGEKFIVLAAAEKFWVSAPEPAIQAEAA